MAGNQNMSWQKISRFILCLLLLSVAACGGGGEPDDNPDGKTSRMTPADTDDRRPFEGSVLIDDDVDEALRASDPYQLDIGDNEPVIENDTLMLTISYSGSCASHDFTLVTNGNFMESDPVQLVVALTHDDNGDTCEAYPTRRYSFDLEPIKTRYQEAYGTDEGSIILHLRYLLYPQEPGGRGVFKLLYTFAP